MVSGVGFFRFGFPICTYVAKTWWNVTFSTDHVRLDKPTAQKSLFQSGDKFNIQVFESQQQEWLFILFILFVTLFHW